MKMYHVILVTAMIVGVCSNWWTDIEPNLLNYIESENKVSVLHFMNVDKKW